MGFNSTFKGLMLLENRLVSCKSSETHRHTCGRKTGSFNVTGRSEQ